MSHLKTICAAILVVLSSLSASAPAAESIKPASYFDPNNPDVQRDLKAVLKELKGFKTLPGTGMNVIEAAGRIMLISSNGRFVVNTPDIRIQDMWNGKVITSVGDMENLSRINFDFMNLKFDTLSALYIGKDGKPLVTVFVDPRCPYCKQLLAQAKTLGETYRFRIVVLGILGEESEKITGTLMCASDKKAALTALLGSEFTGLKTDPACNQKEMVARGQALTKILGISSVPFVVTPNHTAKAGMPKDFGEWLASDSTSAQSVSKAEKEKSK